MSGAWQRAADWLDGKLYVTDEGVEVRLAVSKCDVPGLEYGTTVHGNPTERGKQSAAYSAQKRQLGDDWSYCWESFLPASLWECVPNDVMGLDPEPGDAVGDAAGYHGASHGHL